MNRMAFITFKTFCVTAGLATAGKYDEWYRAWQVAAEEGASESWSVFLCRETGMTEDLFLGKLSEAFDWPRLDLTQLSVAAEVRQRISAKIAFQFNVLPTSYDGSVLQVAVSDPFDSALLNAVRFEADRPVTFALAPRAEIEKAQRKYYGVGAETLDELAKDEPMDLVLSDGKEITGNDQEASVIKFVNQIVWEAHNSRATDIHFEPAEDELRIRNRIDGILHQIPMPPQIKQYQASLISRIKVMAGMNIAEKRLPQDGRINVRIKGEEIDIRVSTVPTVYGESVSLRLLTRGKIFLGLEQLGFDPQEENLLRDIVVKPHGMVLVTGPTGSGKSTSLYAFLTSINSVHKRIITIEEPVEYELKGVNQIAVRADIGLTFAMGLRHILRQDPNVIMVGEIRDLETAEIAIRAALTGHLVFSTLHTNDATSAFTRLVDMGIEPFLVASSVEAVLAQRLVRTICPKCKVEQKVDRDYLYKAGFPLAELAEAKIWHGVGCENCRQLGYQGRMGIYELLVVNEAIRPLVLERKASSTIAQKAVELGMSTLRDDGWRKVRAGRTTVEEVLRVTQAEEHLKALMES